MGHRGNSLYAIALLLSYSSLSPAPIFAHACGMFSAGWGINEATAIVKGEMLELLPQGGLVDTRGVPPFITANARGPYVAVRVTRVIKGDVPFQYILANGDCLFRIDPLGKSVIVFLTKSRLGIYDTPNNAGVLPASSQADPDKEATPKAALIAEMHLALSNPISRDSALDQLASLSNEEGILAARKFIHDRDLRTRARANAILAERNSVSALRVVVSLLQSEMFNRAQLVRDNLASAVYLDLYQAIYTIGLRTCQPPSRSWFGASPGGASPENVEEYARIIAPLVSNKNQQTQAAAVQALNRLRKQAIVPHHQSIKSLSDSDKLLQYNAISGLCHQSARKDCPTQQEYEQRESEWNDLARKCESKGLGVGGQPSY